MKEKILKIKKEKSNQGNKKKKQRIFFIKKGKKKKKIILMMMKKKMKMKIQVMIQKLKNVIKRIKMILCKYNENNFI